MEFLLCLAPGFPLASGMTVSGPASVFEESCLCLINCVKLLPLSLGIDLCFVQVTCSCFSSSFSVTRSNSFSSSLFSLFLLLSLLSVRLWGVDNALIKGEIEEC